jgi:hypothetical protein
MPKAPAKPGGSETEAGQPSECFERFRGFVEAGARPSGLARAGSFHFCFGPGFKVEQSGQVGTKPEYQLDWIADPKTQDLS